VVSSACVWQSFLKIPPKWGKKSLHPTDQPQPFGEDPEQKTVTSQKMNIGKRLQMIPVLKRFGSRKREQFKAPKPGGKEIISLKAKGSNEGLHSLWKKADRIKFS